MKTATITWTKVDEAPALASYALLPILESFTKDTGIELEVADISLVGRIIANFPENLTEEQKIENYLMQLGERVKTPQANVIKLPNISASIPQLQSAIKELQEKVFLAYDNLRKEKGLQIFGIFNTAMRKYVKKGRRIKTRYVDFPVPSHMAIFRDRIILLSWGNLEKPSGVLVKSKEIANQYKEFFEEMWERAQP